MTDTIGTILSIVFTGALAIGVLVLAFKIWSKFVNLLSRFEALRTGGSAPAASRGTSGLVTYRTRNGLADYRFRIERVSDGGFRAYIISHRDYGSRDQGQMVTHRMRDARGDFVCWTGRLSTIEQAREVAALWADKTENYILRGQPF